MPQSAANNIGINYGWSVGESGWKAGVDYNWLALDALTQPRILDKDLATPPGSPTISDAYIVATSPTGAWAGKAGQIAIYNGTGWYFFPPKSGWKVYVVDEAIPYLYNGSAWTSTIAFGSLYSPGAVRIGVQSNIDSSFTSSDPLFISVGASTNNVSLLLTNSTSTTFLSVLELGHSKSATAGDLSVASANGDALGAVTFSGVDTTTGALRFATYLKSLVDASPGASFVPGRLEFHTVSSAGVDQTAMTIKATGNILVGTTTDDAVNRLQVSGSISATALRGGAYTAAVASLPNGIGTAKNPQVQAADTTDFAAVSAHINDGTNNRRAGIFVDQTNGITGISTNAASGVAPFVLRLSGTEIWRAFSGGNIAIGSTSDDGANKLQVSGTIACNNGINISGSAPFIANKTAGDRLLLTGADNATATGGGAIALRDDTSATNAFGIELYAGGSEAARITTNRNLLIGTTTDDATNKLQVAGGIVSNAGTAGIGYAAGAGGAVTQITSRTTGVTLNKTTGAITLVSAAGSATYQSFTLTNSAIGANDIVKVVQKSGTDKYIILVTAVAAGSCQITFATTGGTTTETPVFAFAVIKGAVA